ncbi:M20 family metallopeptidase [Tabrizicola sp.]|uniref:M20 family metallopeptidase n=1 Tax=Tabrizicola sp. TaxID=2005166 RepID=UPI003F345BF0
MIDPIPLLQDLIRIPSCEPPGGELAVAERVARALTDLGVDVRLDQFLPGRANVLGRVAGTGEKPALVFSAHLDTLPAGGGWTRDPFSGVLEDGRVHGRGAADMKSAVAAFVAAAGVLAARKTKLKGDVLLMLTAGESANCIGARRFLAQGLQSEIGAFLCGEPSGLDLVVVEKAILWARVTARGEVGHVSGNGGVNAIWRMTEALAALRALQLQTPAHPLLDGPSLSVGLIRGGTAVNLTPDLCEAEIDVRFAPGIGADDVLAQLRSVLPSGVTIDLTDYKPAVEEAPDSAFVRTCAAAVRAETGVEPRRLGVNYYSDGAILLDGHAAPFCILGPGRLGDSGTADESVSARDVQTAARLYKIIAEEWLA